MLCRCRTARKGSGERPSNSSSIGGRSEARPEVTEVDGAARRSARAGMRAGKSPCRLDPPASGRLADAVKDETEGPGSRPSASFAQLLLERGVRVRLGDDDLARRQAKRVVWRRDDQTERSNGQTSVVEHHAIRAVVVQGTLVVAELLVHDQEPDSRQVDHRVGRWVRAHWCSHHDKPHQLRASIIGGCPELIRGTSVPCRNIGASLRAVRSRRSHSAGSLAGR